MTWLHAARIVFIVLLAAFALAAAVAAARKRT